MEAAVTLKATPAQFDTLREAVSQAAQAQRAVASNATVPGAKRAALQQAAEFEALLAKLR